MGQSTMSRFNLSPEANTTARNSIVSGSQCSTREQVSIAASTDTDSDPSDTESNSNNVYSDLDDTDFNPKDADSDPENIPAVELPTSPAIFTEPSYFKGSFPLPTGGSFLQPVHPDLRLESNRSSYRLQSIAEWYPGEHSGTEYDFD